jgi:hypothetical protein
MRPRFVGAASGSVVIATGLLDEAMLGVESTADSIEALPIAQA